MKKIPQWMQWDSKWVYPFQIPKTFLLMEGSLHDAIRVGWCWVGWSVNREGCAFFTMKKMHSYLIMLFGIVIRLSIRLQLTVMPSVPNYLLYYLWDCFSNTNPSHINSHDWTFRTCSSHPHQPLGFVSLTRKGSLKVIKNRLSSCRS